MKFIVCAILGLTALSGCSPASATPAVPQESMKGYELYSWESDGTWYFSLLIGTNRLKTLEEIQAPDVALQGIDELKPMLESLASGQYVTWMAVDPLAFPPEEIIQQVEKICRDQGLNLSIVE